VRIARPHLLGRDAVPHELRVDPALAYATRDQLRVLTAEVEDEDGAVFGRTLRELQDLGLTSGNSAPLS
jgi:hypothetical protein